GCHDADIKDVFNLCLDKPLLHWEMELVKLLDFWNFTRRDCPIPTSLCKSSPGAFINSHAQAKVKEEDNSKPAPEEAVPESASEEVVPEPLYKTAASPESFIRWPPHQNLQP
ncbi:hypothetical protein M9458_007165, partial [Cirrhinus mrigala]